MNTNEQALSGALLLRLFLGSLWLAQGILKLAAFAVPGLAALAQAMPTPFAWPLALLELAGGLLLLFGLHGRVVSLALLALLAGAMYAPTGGAGAWTPAEPAAGWGYPLFLAAVSLAHLLLGDGMGASPARGADAHGARPWLSRQVGRA